MWGSVLHQPFACAVPRCVLSALALSHSSCLFFRAGAACQREAQQISVCLTNPAGIGVQIAGEGDVSILFLNQHSWAS